MTSFQNANEDLKVQLRNLDRKLKEAEVKCRDVDNKVAYYESAKYTAKDVDIYQGSSEYQDELFEKSNSFDRSCAHILCQFHQYIPDKMLMCRAYKGSYMDPEFRSGCDFVPYTEGEL